MDKFRIWITFETGDSHLDTDWCTQEELLSSLRRLRATGRPEAPSLCIFRAASSWVPVAVLSPFCMNVVSECAPSGGGWGLRQGQLQSQEGAGAADTPACRVETWAPP